MARRNALGRGLGALIPDPPVSPTGDESAPAAAAPDAAATEIEVARIDPNPDQPRRVFDPEEIERLAASIQRHGVLQPVVVRRAGERFELVVGERRWRATQAAGRETIPAVVADVADADRLELALVENVQRQDLNAIELAQAFRAMADADRLELALVENVQRQDLNAIELAQAFRAMADAGATQEEVGSRVGLDRSSVANHLRLLELSRDLQQDVEGGKLSVGHAKALLQVSNPERRRHVRDQIVDRDLSVRQAEVLARDAAGPARRKKQPATSERLDPDLQRVVDLLRDRLKTRVRVQGDEKRGRIEIEYFGAEDLNRIVHAMLDAQ